MKKQRSLLRREHNQLIEFLFLIVYFEFFFFFFFGLRKEKRTVYDTAASMSHALFLFHVMGVCLFFFVSCDLLAHHIYCLAIILIMITFFWGIFR